MSNPHETVPTPPAAPGRRHWLGALNFPLRSALGLGVLLLSLALGTAWLMQRGEARQEASRLASRGRSLAELVAQAVGPQVSFSDSGRLLRLLECAGRDGDLQAGAVLDGDGRVVAHTDVARIGAQVAPVALAPRAGMTIAADGPAELFTGRSGVIYMHPLIGEQGLAGNVALLLPAQPPGSFTQQLWHFFLPAGLLLLAFIGIMQATLRWAMRPTADLFRRLTTALAQASNPETAPAISGEAENCAETIEATVSHLRALHEAKEELTIRSRLLVYEKRRMEVILDHFPDGLIMTDTMRKVAFMNRTAINMLGLSKTEAHPAHGAGNPDLVQLLQRAEQSGQALLPSSINKDDRQVLLSRNPLTGPEGTNLGTLHTLRDITAQQAAQRAQAEFLSQITHELKAPLNTIVTYVEALADEDLLSREERHEFFNTLNAEAARMAQLISNLLQLSRIQLGNLSGRFGFVKSASLIATSAEAVRSQAERAGLHLRVSVPENLPALYGDKDLLGVALTNLITNAIKYTPRDGGVTVRAAADERGLQIEIVDTGIGIPAEEQARIFERFTRSEQAEVQAKPGSGLGLSLVKEIVELHEGRVTVESRPGEGSTFRLWLPVREVGTRLDVAAA